MKNIKILFFLSLFLLIGSNAFAGDKEDVEAVLDKTQDAFNKHDFTSYFLYFTNDNTEFTYVASPLRYNAAEWKAFIEGTSSLAYVDYHGQDFQIQVYNSDAAVATSYYTFTWMEKGGQMNYQSGRASIFFVKQNGKWLITHMHFSKMF